MMYTHFFCELFISDRLFSSACLILHHKSEMLLIHDLTADAYKDFFSPNAFLF